MNLYIDTTKRDGVFVKLIDGNKTMAEISIEVGAKPDQQLLKAIDELLKKASVELVELTAISVNPGPGSFTGTRVGVTVANTLSMVLGLPINDQPAGSFVVPAYDTEPKISNH